MCGRALLGEEATCIPMDPDGPTPSFIIHWRDHKTSVPPKLI
jgi:hypothetical protein